MKSTDQEGPGEERRKVFSDAEMEAMQDAKKERKKGKNADRRGRPARQGQGAEGPRSRDRRKAPRDRQGGRAPASRPRPGTACRPMPAPTARSSCFFTPAGKFKSRYATLRFQRRRQARRRQHVADVVGADQARRCRGEEDRGAGEEGRGLSSRKILYLVRSYSAWRRRLRCALWRVPASGVSKSRPPGRHLNQRGMARWLRQTASTARSRSAARARTISRTSRSISRSARSRCSPASRARANRRWSSAPSRRRASG